MSYFAISAAVNAISSLMLGLFVFTKNKHAAVNKAFFVYCLSATLWSVGYFFWQIAHTSDAAVFWCKVLMMGAIMIPVLQTRFIRRVLGLPAEKKLMFLLYLYSGVFLLSNLSDYIVARVEPRGGFDFWPVAGSFFPFFLLVWVGIVIYNFVLIFDNYHKVDKRTKVFLIYLTVATIISYIGGITNYPLWFGIDIKPWGNILITAYSIIVAYAVIRNKFLNVEVMKSEVAVFTGFFLLIIDGLISDNLIIGLMRFLIILLFAIIGWNYLKSFVEIEKKNKQLEVDKKELVELDKMKDEFLQMATHELNTPITVIQGKLDMAINEDLCKLTPEQKKFFTPVFDDTMRLAELSKDILNVARVDQHRLKINAEEADLGALISKIVKSFEVKAKEKENSIAYIPMSKELPKIKFDQSKVGEVITNLISNANKFTEKGKIAVTSKLKDGEIIISVADTGIGISKEDQEHLFQKFYQVGRFDPDNPQEQQGSGLGLYISKNIIELHGGKMWLESEKGKGATFYFSLPLEYKEIKQAEKTA